MADTKVSALPAASAVAGANEFPINEAAVSKKVSATQLAAWMFEGRGLDVKKHFGAIGDGIVNDTTALQAAFDSDVPIYIPVGTYKVTSTLTVPQYAEIYGSGYNCVIQASSVSGAVVKFDITPGLTGDGCFRNIRISGTATTGLDAVEIPEGFVIDHIWLQGGTFTDGYKFALVFGNSITNLSTRGATISGKCFAVSSGFAANYCANWYTSNFSTYNFWMDTSTLNSIGNTFDNLTAQGGLTGLYVGSGMHNSTFNAFYSENVVHPIVLGDWDGSDRSYGLTFNSPIISGPLVGHPSYSSRVVGIDISYANAVTINSPAFECSFDVATAAPVTFTGGGGTGAVAIARVTAAGLVSSVEVLYGGTGYTSNPTVSFGGAGTGATATAARTGTVVTSVTVTAAGTGYEITAMPAVRYYATVPGNVLINAPFISSGASAGFHLLYPWIVRHPSAFSTSGITVQSDSHLDVDGHSAGTNLIRAAGFGHQHYLVWFSNAGVQQVSSYVPPVYP